MRATWIIGMMIQVARGESANRSLSATKDQVHSPWNALTKPVANNGYGLSITEALTAVDIIEDEFFLLEDLTECFSQWKRLVRSNGVMGKNVHDANLVASALAHGLRHIATLNERDFRRYAEIEIVSITLDGR